MMRGYDYEFTEGASATLVKVQRYYGGEEHS